MRHIGLDVGRDFAHVAVVEGTGQARRLPRVAMGDEFRAFAATLGPEDVVALEASTNTWALADLLGRHAGRVVVSNPLRTRAIAAAKRKLAVLVWHLLAKDEDCRFAPPARTAYKCRHLDRLAGRAWTRPSQRGATGSSHDRGRARLRGGGDPREPALRQAIDRVRADHTPAPEA
jgi:hypothetical protein